MRGGSVYIMTNRPDGTLYVGVTNCLARRAGEHKEGDGSRFTARYGLKMLVYAEYHEEIRAAIQRETSLKRWPRVWKVESRLGGFGFGGTAPGLRAIAAHDGKTGKRSDDEADGPSPLSWPGLTRP